MQDRVHTAHDVRETSATVGSATVLTRPDKAHSVELVAGQSIVLRRVGREDDYPPMYLIVGHEELGIISRGMVRGFIPEFE